MLTSAQVHAVHCAAAWPRLLSTPLTTEHNQSLALRVTRPVPMRVTLLRLLSHWSASSHIARPLLRPIPLRVRMSDTAHSQPWRPPGRGSGRAKSGGEGWREAKSPAPKPKCSAPAKQCGAPKIIHVGKIPRETWRVVPIRILQNI